MNLRRNFFSLVIGLTLILAGVSALLDTAHIVDLGWIFSTFWPLLLISLAVSRALVKDWKGALFMGVIGVVAQLAALGLTTIDVWGLVWPLIILIIGISIISKAFSRPNVEGSGATFGETVIFSGLEKVVTDQAFQTGSIMTFFGGAEIDLTKAKYNEGKAMIDVLAAFGGITIKVPADVKVVMEVTALFGGSSDKRRTDDTDAKQTLVVRGYALFGAVEIQ